MKFLGGVLTTFIANALGLVLASALVSNFTITDSLVAGGMVAGLLTLIYTFVRPFIKFVLTPFIFLTIGLASFFINAGLLYALDKISSGLTINGLGALFLGTAIISISNLLFHILYRVLRVVI